MDDVVIPERTYHRSISQLKKVSKCGEQFKLEKFSDPRPPKSPAAWLALGIALHETFTEWEHLDRRSSKQDLIEEFAMMYDITISELLEEQPDLSLWSKPPNTKSVENSISNYRTRGIEKDVPWYFDRCIAAGWEVAELNGVKLLEVEFSIELGDITAYGFVDRVQWWRADRRYTIEDTKTGSPDSDDFDPRQLKLYQIAMMKMFGIDISHGRYWYTKIDRGSKWFDLSQIDELTVIDQYATLDRMIGERLFLPNPGKHCGLCPVKNICSIGAVT